MTLSVLLGTPYWIGVVVVGAVVTANVALGGMRGITFVQAFQYWVKLTAISLPAVVLLLHYQADGRPDLAPAERPAFEQATTVEMGAAARFRVDGPVTVAATGTLDGRAVDGPVRLAAGVHEAGEGTDLRFPAGAPVPHDLDVPAASGEVWSRPFGPIGEDRDHPLFSTYSLILATFLGTMGLPHILVRFYTNPDGRAARETTVIVLLLMGAFYVFPPVYGVLGRHYAPDLYLTGATDAVVLVLPGRVVGGLAGELVSGLVAAGAFAAFLSTASGLLVSVAGALSHDLLRGTVADFRRAAVVAGGVAVVLGLGVARFDISLLVGWAFAIAASSFCPLLVLGIWWRGLTAPGALAGVVLGGGSASAAILLTMGGYGGTGWQGALLGQPAAWSVPLAFATMVVVSRATRARVPADVGAKLLTLHAPEHLGLGRALHG